MLCTFDDMSGNDPGLVISDLSIDKGLAKIDFSLNDPLEVSSKDLVIEL